MAKSSRKRSTEIRGENTSFGHNHAWLFSWHQSFWKPFFLPVQTSTTNLQGDRSGKQNIHTFCRKVTGCSHLQLNYMTLHGRDAYQMSKPNWQGHCLLRSDDLSQEFHRFSQHLQRINSKGGMAWNKILCKDNWIILKQDIQTTGMLGRLWGQL